MRSATVRRMSDCPTIQSTLDMSLSLGLSLKAAESVFFRLARSRVIFPKARARRGVTSMSSSMLPVCDFLYDTLFYSSKLSPRKNPNGQWPLGTSLRPCAEYHKYPLKGSGLVPMSVSNAIAEFTASESMRLELPLVMLSAPRISAVHELWSELLGSATGLPEPCHIPVSTVEHENTQLVWHRRSAKHPDKNLTLCKWEGDCAACDLSDNQGPLPVYLSVTEQEAFDETGIVPDNAHFCLLCIRRDAQVMCLVNQKIVTDPCSQTGRGCFAVPPFQNLVDVVGGYRHEALGVRATEQMVLPVNIVGVSGALRVRYNPFDDRFFVDQGPIIYGASPLNG